LTVPHLLADPRSLRSYPRRSYAAPLLLIAAAFGCSSDQVTAPDPVVVAAVSLTPDSTDLRVGQTLQFEASPRDAAGNALANVPIEWSTSDSMRVRVSATGLATGVGTGRGVVTATAGGRTASAVIDVMPVADTLDAPAGSAAVVAFPTRVAVLRPDDYMPGASGLGTLPVSYNTVIATVDPAATVEEINALLRDLDAEIIGSVPGLAGQQPGFLVLRFPTTSHTALDSVIISLEASPAIRSVAREVLLDIDLVSRFSDDSAIADWDWQPLRPFTGLPPGNWGLKVMRVPQLWNFNAAVVDATLTGVYDSGFSDHPDLVCAENRTPSGAATSRPSHGNHVAGTVGATFDNGLGIDGINPFARLVCMGGAVSTATLLTGLVELVTTSEIEELRVLNFSLGYNWMKQGVIPEQAPEARNLVQLQGEAVRAVLENVAGRGRQLPVIVATAGNDTIQAARWASPFNYAAIELDTHPIIVVEAIMLDNDGRSQRRAPFSNTGGMLSAPGVHIMSTVSPIDSEGGRYERMSGTSQAAPHVTGLISYLYALDPTFPSPTLASNPMADLLVASAVPLLGAPPRVDAFAAAFELDRIRGGSILRGLLDIDDGSPDGNTRVDPLNGDTLRADGPDARDGRIDMRDFRRFRDWLLQVEATPGVVVDGAADHPKKDLNGDGFVGEPDFENIFPRGDFNGDGIISRTATAEVGGSFSGALLTDLQIFQSLFEDLLYGVHELPDLLDSGDVHVRPLRCLAAIGATQVRGAIYRGDDETAHRVFTVTPDMPYQVLTEASIGESYRVQLEVRDADGEALGGFIDRFAFTPGSDQPYDPDCFRLELELVFPEQVAAGSTEPLLISALRVDAVTGDTVAAAGADINVSVIGGEADDAFGITDAEGVYSTMVRVNEEAETLTIIVEVDTPNGNASGLVQREMAPLEIVREGLRPAAVNQFYVDTITATGGDAANRWLVDAGALPPGIQLGNQTGRLIGIPTAEGDFPVRFRVTNGERSDTATLNIEVRPALTIATDSLPDAVIDVPYLATLQVAGGSDEIPAWGIASGSLPPGSRCR
jgi:subtilisin family serine protease